MMWLLNNPKVAGVLVIMLVVGFGAFSVGQGTVQSAWNKDKLAQAEANAAATEKNQLTINNLEKTKHENISRINDLSRDLRTTRVQLPKVSCPSSNPTAGGRDDDSTIAGAFSERAEEGLGTFKSSVDTRAAEADRIVEECRVVLEWAKSLQAQDGKL